MIKQLGTMITMMILHNFGHKVLQMLSFNHLTRFSNLKDFSHKVDHFVQGLDMLSTVRLSQTLIHPRQMLKLLRKVV